MKNMYLTVVATIFLFISCDNGTIGKYKKEPLPENFSYFTIADNSNVSLEKNELTIEITSKLTEGQIATLAEKVFNSKEKQRRFYIFYQLPGMKKGSSAWASSHFDPDLEIQIFGSTSQQDEKANMISNEVVDGEIVGKWREEQASSSNYIIYKKENKLFLKFIFKEAYNVVG